MLEDGNTCEKKGDESREEEESAGELVLFPVTIFLFVIVGVMTIMFGAYCIGRDGKEDEKGCMSIGCIRMVSMMSGKMDWSVDPCEDFAQYACGSFYKNTRLPDKLPMFSAFNEVGDENDAALRVILEDEVKTDDPSFVRKIKTYYQNCMDEDAIDEIGLKPYLSSKFPKLWPTLNADWTNESFNLNDMLVLYARDFVQPLIMYSSFVDSNDPSKYVLAVSQQEFVLHLVMKVVPDMWPSFTNFYGKFAKELGAPADVAFADGAELARFDTELAKIMVDMPTQNLSSVQRSTIKQMAKDYPGIDFHRIIQAGFDSINMKVPIDHPLIYIGPGYFKNLKSVLDKAQIRNIMNRLAFSHALARVGKLTRKTRGLMHNYTTFADINGKMPQQPRWQTCLKETDKFFLEGAGKAFVKEKFSRDPKQYMEKMVANTKREYEGMLQENEWIDPKTKQAALLKLNKMLSLVAYPDNNFSDDELDKRYKEYGVYDGEYYKSFVGVDKKFMEEAFRTLDKDVDRKKWTKSIKTANAFYDRSQNKIVIPAGVLQFPFFADLAPSSVNYGAIGTLIGHEISHGFDSEGSKMNHEGIYSAWWQPETWKEFLNRTKCIVDHYSKFEIKELTKAGKTSEKMNYLNGKRTLAENAADIGGLNAAYRAYKAYSAKHPDEKSLPGLGLTSDQQFFLAYAQKWCEKRAIMWLNSGVHSPGRFRIKGPLQNNYDFPKAFNCPEGSPMNPVDKCRLWF